MSALISLLALAAAPSGPALRYADDGGVLTIRAVDADVVQIVYAPNGAKDRPTEIMDPHGLRNAESMGATHGDELDTDDVQVGVAPNSFSITGDGATLKFDRASLAKGVLKFDHPKDENLYGMRGLSLRDGPDARVKRANGLFRNEGATVAAGAQGDGGAPLAYSTHWGVLVDSVDGDFANSASTMAFTKDSRKTIEAYVIFGPPKRIIEAATDLTGHAEMVPKWALGFMNSQWGSDEHEVKSIVGLYRDKQIPLDAFILDFDYKAWGEDDFGELRWNSTNGPGNVAPMKYPDGQSGAFGRAMAHEGVHLVGIMKPRFLLETVDHKPTMAAKEISAHDGWLPGRKPYMDYFSHRLTNDLDFSRPDARKFFWAHSVNLLRTGISGWWNDEADFGFPSLGFMNMEQALYEGQRKATNQRVWSLNRNFYLGAQRFAFGTWSGDIGTGFGVMGDQRVRMLDTIDLGQPHWSMDTGGFGGHPSSENYARWMEFASVCPIMRVHGTFGQKRQPWVYGPVAEAAAKKAIDFRYSLAPSLYSWEREASEDGVGIVRPLFWEFPDDPGSANVTDAWMLGDELLVSPVCEKGARRHTVYLPPGRWYEYGSDLVHDGGQELNIPVDSTGWSDTPIFVRAGSILATEAVKQYAGETPTTEVTLDVWPSSSHRAEFQVYDDDGETYKYEKGAYFSQWITATGNADDLTLNIGAKDGGYRSPIKLYRVRIHGAAGEKALWNMQSVGTSDEGDVLVVDIPAGQAGTLAVHATG